uniref:NADH-ubiquinone oxidoreductase chain 2 n=1 Tax=Bacillus atticus TaxID=36825 RepID=E2DHX5_9NEOP|nr:NADH dehydrogenase subunit 2 [Bacillus atticus]
MLFLILLGSSVLISVSSNSWFIIWMGMEINMMSFMPLIIEQNNLTSKESALTYFMIQTIASMIMMMSIITMMINKNYMNIIVKEMNNMMMMSVLMMKSGISPFHFWMPKMMEGMSWNKCFILMTFQKIIPLMIMSNIIKMNWLSMSAMMMSIIIGAIGGLNQTSIRKIMAYSSITNNGWMMAAMLISETMWMFYFMMYTIMTATLTISMNMLKVYHINQLMSTNMTKMKKFILMMNLLSISGLPPMMGFMPKWMVIQSNLSNNEIMLMTMMTLMTLITIYYYLRIMYSTLMLSNSEPKWNNKKMEFNNNKLMFLSVLSLMGLPFITLIISLY